MGSFQNVSLVRLAVEFVERLSDVLSNVEDLLGSYTANHLGKREELVGIGADCIDYAVTFPHSEHSWAFSRPFMLLGLLIYAFAFPCDSLGLPKDAADTTMFSSGAPRWVYQKMRFFVRAKLYATGGGAVPYRPPVLPQAWLKAVPQRWPRTNLLPRKILRALGCPLANSTSFIDMILGGTTEIGNSLPQLLECRKDLAIFNAAGYGSYHKNNPNDKLDLLMVFKPMLQIRPAFVGQAQVFQLVSLVLDEYVHTPSGLFLEFGVYKGSTLNAIARRLQALGGGKVYGFDSFRGLPSTFRGGARSIEGAKEDLLAGHFRLDALPNVGMNAELVIGYFNDTLPAFLKDRLPEPGCSPPQQLRFLHMDCDLADSTREVLIALAPLITTGSILVFDDIINFQGFHEGALRGLRDFLATGLFQKKLEVLAAPFNMHILDAETQQDYEDSQRDDGWDLERAIALRVID